MEKNDTNIVHMPKSKKAASTPTKLPNTVKHLYEQAKFNEDEKVLFIEVFQHVCKMQKGYGFHPDNFAVKVKGFLWALQDFPMDDIIRGMQLYVLDNNDIPTPSDIKKILYPPKQPLSPALYVEIKKRLRDGNVLISRQEREFCREFERQELEKAKHGNDSLTRITQQPDHDNNPPNDY